MVSAVHAGRAIRAVAKRLSVSVATVAYWLRHRPAPCNGCCGWLDRSHAPHNPRRTGSAMVNRVLRVRQELEASDLGRFFFNHWTIRRADTQRSGVVGDLGAGHRIGAMVRSLLVEQSTSSLSGPGRTADMERTASEKGIMMQRKWLWAGVLALPLAVGGGLVFAASHV